MESSDKELKQLFSWQKKMLPYMIGIIVLLTFFFFTASFIQLYYLHQRIEKSPELNLDSVMTFLESNDKELNATERLNYVRWGTLALLEKHALQRRYHQANVLLMSRVWTSYLGFVTGMILSLVGAVFILGKLRETETKIDVGSSNWKFAVATASPGLVLSILGVTLMIITIITHFEIEVQDGPLFTPVWNKIYFQQTPKPKSFPIDKDSIETSLDEMFK